MSKPIPVIVTNQYTKGQMKLAKAHNINALKRLKFAVDTLSAMEELPSGYRPHKLKGVDNTWECHITGDVLLTWRYVNNELILELHLLNLTNHDKLDRKSKIHGNLELIYLQ